MICGFRLLHFSLGHVVNDVHKDCSLVSAYCACVQTFIIFICSFLSFFEKIRHDLWEPVMFHGVSPLFVYFKCLENLEKKCLKCPFFCELLLFLNKSVVGSFFWLSYSWKFYFGKVSVYYL